MLLTYAVLVDLDFKPAQEVQGSNSYHTSFVRFIPKHFIYLNGIENGIIF